MGYSCAEVSVLLLLLACSVRDYLPQGPSLSEAGAADWLSGAQAPVVYTGPPAVDYPVLPVQLFGVHYLEDIVIETRHPDWSMHEYARLRLDGQERWIAKDSDPDGVQTVTADMPDIETWLPEIPIPRVAGPVQEVDDASTDSQIDVTFRYTNPAGEQVEVHFSAPRPLSLEDKRSSSTFNHSQQIVSAVLDVPRRQLSDVEAEVSFDGEPVAIRRVLGLVPVAALLDQYQGGFAVTSMRMTADASGALSVERPIPGQDWPTRGQESWRVDGEEGDLTLLHVSAGTTWRYRFVEGGLREASVADADGELVRLELSAALPDLRRPFTGAVDRNFVLYINGQRSGHGVFTATCDGTSAHLAVQPVAPRWFAERPMTTAIHFDDGATDITAVMGL